MSALAPPVSPPPVSPPSDAAAPATSDVAPPGPATLHVCTTCRAGLTLAEGETAPGAVLHAALVALRPDDGRIRPVACLASCARGCAAALTAPGKWSTLLGGLALAHAADLLDLLDLYERSATGTVLPSRRAPSLRSTVTGRIPG